MRTDRELLDRTAKAPGMGIQRSSWDDPLNRDFLMIGNGPRNFGQAPKRAVVLARPPHSVSRRPVQPQEGFVFLSCILSTCQFS